MILQLNKFFNLAVLSFMSRASACYTQYTMCNQSNYMLYSNRIDIRLKHFNLHFFFFQISNETIMIWKYRVGWNAAKTRVFVSWSCAINVISCYHPPVPHFIQGAMVPACWVSNAMFIHLPLLLLLLLSFKLHLSLWLTHSFLHAFASLI